MSAGLLRATAVVAPACDLTAGGSPSLPKLTGVDNEWNKGKPAGRSKGKTSNTQTTRACKPNDVKAVNPRRERSSHDESSVASNMVSSLIEFAVNAKDTGTFSAAPAGANKKGRAGRGLLELFRHTRCRRNAT